MNICTDRVHLREFTPEDLSSISKIYSDAEVMKYIGRGGPADEISAGRMLEAFMKSYRKNGFGIWACVENSSGEIIGHCGFNILPDGNDVEIAYLLDKPFWGKGIATSIAAETIRYGFEFLNLPKIVALAYPGNLASVRVITKLGMKYEGTREFFGAEFSFYSKHNPDRP